MSGLRPCRELRPQLQAIENPVAPRLVLVAVGTSAATARTACRICSLQLLNCRCMKDGCSPEGR